MNEFTRLANLASERLGGRVLDANDEFFGAKECLLRHAPPVFDPDRYTDRGKWMDGWETRRRRDDGHDWCVVRLGAPCIVRGVDIDTTHFLGNHAPVASIEAIEWSRDDEDLAGAAWRPLLGRHALGPGRSNLIAVDDDRVVTHVRLCIHPDGGVARLRVHGEPRPDIATLVAAGPIDLAGVLHGGVVVGCSDEFFGTPDHLLLPDRPLHMGDGWETRRRRGEDYASLGHDWCVIRLGCRARLEQLEIDTTHFKGNYPDRCGVDRVDLPALALLEPPPAEADWQPLLESAAMQPDAPHAFSALDASPCTHLRLRMHPDGGVARFRAVGRPAGIADP